MSFLRGICARVCDCALVSRTPLQPTDPPLSLLFPRPNSFSGDELSLQVSILGPDGASLYSEGPLRVSEASGYSVPASEGSFRLRLFRQGIYKVTLSNPSTNSPRTVAFAWLLGRDSDDAFTARGVPPAGAAAAGSDSTVEQTVAAMLARVSRVHKSLDEVVSLQQFSDVRFSRAFSAAKLTGGRVMGWTLFESALVVAVAVLQALWIRSFEVRGPLAAFLASSSARFGKGASAASLRTGAVSRHTGNAASHAV